MADEALHDLVLAELEPLGVRSRAMFGGHGLYRGKKFFGIVTAGQLYFRTDEDSRRDYLDRGMPALQPPANRTRGPKTVSCFVPGRRRPRRLSRLTSPPSK